MSSFTVYQTAPITTNSTEPQVARCKWIIVQGVKHTLKVSVYLVFFERCTPYICERKSVLLRGPWNKSQIRPTLVLSIVNMSNSKTVSAINLQIWIVIVNRLNTIDNNLCVIHASLLITNDIYVLRDIEKRTIILKLTTTQLTFIPYITGPIEPLRFWHLGHIVDPPLLAIFSLWCVAATKCQSLDPRFRDLLRNKSYLSSRTFAGSTTLRRQD